MGEERKAAAEGVLYRMWKEEWDDLDIVIRQTGDVQFWAEVLRCELDIRSVSDGVLNGEALLAKLMDFDVQSISPFHYAGPRGADQVLRKGLQFGLSVDVALCNGVTALHLAALCGNMEAVVQLVDEFMANVNAEDRRNWRPLHYASVQGHMSVVEFLVKRGADIGARDKEGATAAYRARQYRHEPVVSCLLSVYGDGDILLIEQVNAQPGNNYTYAVVDKERKAKVKYVPEKRLCMKIDNEDIRFPDNSSLTAQSEKDYACVTDENSIVEMNKTEEEADDKDANEMAAVLAGFDQSKFRRRPHHYEEITIHPGSSPSDLELRDGDASTVDESAAALATNSLKSTSAKSDEDIGKTVKLKTQRRQNDYEEVDDIEPSHSDTTKLAKNVPDLPHCRRDPCYEEIKLSPGEETLIQTQDDSGDIYSQNNGTSNSETNIRWSAYQKRAHQYEEVELLSGTGLEKEHTGDEEDSKMAITGNRKFRSHLYEEIDLPVETGTNTQDVDQDAVEETVRRILRKELEKLRFVERVLVMDQGHKIPKDVTGNFSSHRETAQSSGSETDSSLEAVITLRRLQCILREELETFGRRRIGSTSSDELSADCSQEQQQQQQQQQHPNNSNLKAEGCHDGKTGNFMEASKGEAVEDGKNGKAKIATDNHPKNHLQPGFSSTERKKPGKSDKISQRFFPRISHNKRKPKLTEGNDNVKQKEQDRSNIDDKHENNEKYSVSTLVRNWEQEQSLAAGQSRFYMKVKNKDSSSDI